MYSREPVALERDTRAIQIPEGIPTIMPEGSRVIITQQLGGSYTVMTDRGALFRIDERDADALGREAAEKDNSINDDDLSVRSSAAR